MAVAFLERMVGIHRDKTLENERRVAGIYMRRKFLLTKKKEYMEGIENRRKLAKDYILRGFRPEAEDELIIAHFYKDNLKLASTALVQIERMTASRERADLIQTTGAVMEDVYLWMKQGMSVMKAETVSDRSVEMDNMLKEIDRMQEKLNQSADNAIRQTLTTHDMDNIREELNDMIEYDDDEDATYYDQEDEETFEEAEVVNISPDTQHRGEGDFHEVILPRKKKTRKEEQKNKRSMPRQRTSNDLIVESAST